MQEVTEPRAISNGNLAAMLTAALAAAMAVSAAVWVVYSMRKKALEYEQL
jgi:uncharacterized membrane protein